MRTCWRAEEGFKLKKKKKISHSLNPREQDRANCSEPCSEVERALLNCVPGWAQMSHWKAAMSVSPLRWLALFLSALKVGRGWFISVTLCLWGCQEISPLKAKKKKNFSCLLASHKFKAQFYLFIYLFIYFYHLVCVSSEWCMKRLLLAALRMKVRSSLSERPRWYFCGSKCSRWSSSAQQHRPGSSS